MVEVAFVDFDNNRASIVVETTKWLRVVPDVDGAHIMHKIVPVDDRVFRDVQVPRHVLHGDLRRPAEQQPYKFPEWKVALEERVEPNVPLLPSKSMEARLLSKSTKATSTIGSITAAGLTSVNGFSVQWRERERPLQDAGGAGPEGCHHPAHHPALATTRHPHHVGWVAGIP